MSRLVDLLRAGGPGAIGAVVVGGLGAALGVVALVVALTRGRGGARLGVMTLGLSALAAALGIGATVSLKAQVHQAIGSVSPVMGERILRAGYQEAQEASLVGALAAALPFLLGLAAAVIATFFTRVPSPERRQGEAAGTGASVNLPLVAVLVFGVGAALVLGGALASWRRSLPTVRYAFPAEDADAWALADATSAVEASSGAGTSCSTLEAALDPFTGPFPLPWPRPPFVRAPPPEIPWRPAAARCVDVAIDAWFGKRITSVVWQYEGLLGSSLVTTEEERSRILSARESRAD